jgi:hypothetical protein
MKNENSKNPEKNKSSSPLEREGKTLFSEREIKAIVKDFVGAYISGQIKILFPTIECIIDGEEERGGKISRTEAARIESEIKRDFSKRIAICAGATKATQKEQEVALSELFDNIISMRNGERIKGVFTDYGLEARIKRLEEGIDKVNNLVEEIVEWIMRGVVDK